MAERTRSIRSLWKRRIWLGVIWLIVAALVLASCGPGVPEGEEEEEEEEEESPTLSIGEMFQTPALGVTISEAIVADSYEYYDEASESMTTEEANSGMSFFIITVEFECLGGWGIGANGNLLQVRGQFMVSDSEGNTYSYRHYSGEDPLILSPYLNIGDKVEGKILYEVQEGASGLKVAYMGRISPRPKLAEWVID